MEENIWQFITLIVCVYIIFECRRLSRIPVFGAYALLLASSAAATAIFYALTVFTDWSGGHIWSAPIRLFSFLMLAVFVNKIQKAAHRG